MSNLFTKEQVEDLLNYIGVDKIQQWKGDKINFCCPIHGETHPSCGINIDYTNEDRDILHGQVFNCFACNKSGNLAWFTYLSLPDKFKSYGDAVKFLERRYGVNVDQVQKRKGKIHLLKRYGEQSIESNVRKVIPYYKLSSFRSGRETYKYFYDRGFDKSDLIEYEIGRDIERETVTIPVFWEDHTVAGVIGRYIDPNRPKNYRYEIYDNFSKSSILFPLDKVEPKNGTVILVEGQFDCIMMRKWGFKETVSSLGNKLSYAQMEQLKMICNTVIILYDNDERGIAAINKARSQLKNSFKVKTCDYTNVVGKDPIEWGEEQTRGILSTATLLKTKLRKI